MIFAVRSQCTHPVNQTTRLFSTPDCRSQKPIHSVCGTLGIHFGIHFDVSHDVHLSSLCFFFHLLLRGDYVGLCVSSNVYLLYLRYLSPYSPLFTFIQQTLPLFTQGNVRGRRHRIPFPFSETCYRSHCSHVHLLRGLDPLSESSGCLALGRRLHAGKNTTHSVNTY